MELNSGRRLIMEKVEHILSSSSLVKMGFKRIISKDNTSFHFISNEVFITIEWDGYMLIYFREKDEHQGIVKKERITIEECRMFLIYSEGRDSKIENKETK